MKNPFDKYMERHIERDFDRLTKIPNERPDLLRRDARKRYIRATAFGAIAVANYILEGKNYVPKDIQPEAHIANVVLWVAAGGVALSQGVKGFFQQFRADELSFLALERQLQEQDEFPDQPSEELGPNGHPD